MRTRTTALVLMAFSVLAFGMFLARTNRATPAQPAAGQPGTDGTTDDPNARAAWQWQRLHNPATGTLPPDIRRRELAFAQSLPTIEQLRARGKRAGASPASVMPTATWQAIGPDNVGGRTRALAVDAANDNNILAGGASGGMWRSTDAGATWTKTTAPNELHAVSCIAQDRRAGKRHIWYYAAGGELEGASPQGGGGAYYHGDGIYRSTDSGAHWVLLPATRSGTPQQWDGPFDYVWNIATDPATTGESRVYAATHGAIFRSGNGGDTWSTVLGNGDARFTDVIVAPNGVAYATLSSEGGTNGIWRSADGITWARITPAGWPTTFGRIVAAAAPSNPNMVYFYGITPGGGTNGQSIWKYQYLSGDGSGAGGAWENRSGAIPTAASMGSDVGGWGGSNYDLVIAVHPARENVVFIGGVNLYRSTDGFATPANVAWIGGYTPNVWQVIGHHCDQHAMAFGPGEPATLYSGNDGGVSVADNCEAATVTWRSLNNGYRTSQFYTITVAPRATDQIQVAGGMQDNAAWFGTGGSKRWRSYWGGYGSYAGDGGPCAIVNDSTVYYSGAGGDIHRTNPRDSGTFGTAVTPANATNRAFVTPYILDPTNPTVMYLAAGNRVWRNSNLATNAPATNNWAEMTNTAVSGSVTTLAGSTAPAGRLYFGSSQGKVYRVDDALHAEPNNPAAVRDISGANFPANAYVSCIAVDPTNADRMLVVFSNYAIRSLFHTDNGGQSWRDVSGSLEERADGSGAGPSCRWAEILPVQGGVVYLVATSAGLYSTLDIEAAQPQWGLEGATTIGNVVVDMIDARVADGFVAIGTHGAGAFATNYGAQPPPKPAAAFVADRTTGDTATVIHLADQSTNTPTSWQWAFQPPTVRFLQGTTARSQHPVVQFPAAGQYSVTLTAANAGGADSATRQAYITIGLSAVPGTAAVTGDVLGLATPNPARESASIGFRLAAAGPVRLVLIGNTGAEIATLLNQTMEPGEHTFRLNTARIPAGLYFYRLEHGGGSSTRTLVVMR